MRIGILKFFAASSAMLCGGELVMAEQLTPANTSTTGQISSTTRKSSIKTELTEWTDEKRSRKIPIKFYFPNSSINGPHPVVIFSHGLGGSREAASYLGEYWAGKGYFGVFIQHPGSDTSVWRSVQPGNKQEFMSKMQGAANGDNLILRAEDVKFVLDELERQSKNSLKDRIDLSRVAMSGHSFGAGTTLVVAGQNFNPFAANPKFIDKRIKAAIYLCPPVNEFGKRNPQKTFGTIQIPGMLLTGTEDNSPIGRTSAEERRLPFDGISAPHQFLVNFYGADHAVFGGRSFRAAKSGDDEFHKMIEEITGKFLDAVLRGDASAWHWLEGSGAAEYLAKAAKFERK